MANPNRVQDHLDYLKFKFMTISILKIKEQNFYVADINLN